MKCSKESHRVIAYTMKRCPNCNSKKIRGSKEVGFKCPCGFETLPMNHNPDNGGVTIDTRISPYIINKSPLDWQNSTIGSSLKNSPLFGKVHDLHNNAYKFRITRDAEVDWPRQPGFKGKRYMISYKGMKIHKTVTWLIIYNEGRNRVPLRDLNETSVHILQGLSNLAKEIASKYGFEIDPSPLTASKNRPEVKTPFVSALKFIEPEVQAVYQPPSPIEMKGSNAVPNSYNLTETLTNLLELTKLEYQNKIKHDAVLDCMLKTQEKTQETMEAIKNNTQRPTDLTYKIKSALGLWSAKFKIKTTPTN